MLGRKWTQPEQLLTHQQLSMKLGESQSWHNCWLRQIVQPAEHRLILSTSSTKFTVVLGVIFKLQLCTTELEQAIPTGVEEEERRKDSFWLAVGVVADNLTSALLLAQYLSAKTIRQQLGRVEKVSPPVMGQPYSPVFSIRDAAALARRLSCPSALQAQQYFWEYQTGQTYAYWYITHRKTSLMLPLTKEQAEQELMQLLGRGPLAPFQQDTLPPDTQAEPSQQQYWEQRWQMLLLEQYRQLDSEQFANRQEPETNWQPSLQDQQVEGVYWLHEVQLWGQGLQVKIEALRQQPEAHPEQSQALEHFRQFSKQLLQQPLLRQYPSLQALAATVETQLAAFMIVHKLQALLTNTQGCRQEVQVEEELHCLQLEGQTAQTEAEAEQNQIWQVAHAVEEAQVWHSLGQGRQLVLDPEGQRESWRRGRSRMARVSQQSMPILNSKLIYLKQSLLRILQNMQSTTTRRWKLFSHPPHPELPESHDKFRSHSKNKESKPNLLIRTASSKFIPKPNVPLDPKRAKPKETAREVSIQYKGNKVQRKGTVSSEIDMVKMKEVKKQMEAISSQASKNERVLLEAAAMIAEKYKFKLVVSQTDHNPLSLKEVSPSDDNIKEEHSIRSTRCSGGPEAGGSSKTVASVSDSLDHSASKKDRITSYYFDFPS